jgi:hypothetical protein
MFHGSVAVADAAGNSLMARSAEACRRFAAGSGVDAFLTAWAFPVFEPVHSCRRRRGVDDAGPLAIASRSGRIVVNAGRDHGLNLSRGQGADEASVSWGVLVFLNQVKDGRCRISDVELLAPDREYDLGGERLLWLGAADEAQGLEFLRSLLGRNNDRDLRQHLVFALYMFRGTQAVSDLIGLARRDPDTAVRKDAIFWLGQKASAAAVRALGDVIASPEILEVKKHAIFALSQLPEDKGTPLLLEIARRNPHAGLRKEAIFWLGESGDPRALDFFEDILLK